MLQRKPVVCPKHQRRHRRLDGYGGREGHWGCPVCVKEWSDAVKMEIANHLKWHGGGGNFREFNRKRKESAS